MVHSGLFLGQSIVCFDDRSLISNLHSKFLKFIANMLVWTIMNGPVEKGTSVGTRCGYSIQVSELWISEPRCFQDVQNYSNQDDSIKHILWKSETMFQSNTFSKQRTEARVFNDVYGDRRHYLPANSRMHCGMQFSIQRTLKRNRYSAGTSIFHERFWFCIWTKIHGYWRIAVGVSKTIRS